MCLSMLQASLKNWSERGAKELSRAHHYLRLSVAESRCAPGLWRERERSSAEVLRETAAANANGEEGGQ